MTANLHQGGCHGRLPSHAMSDQDTLLDAQLREEVFQITTHCFIGQLRAVGTVTMVTGIYSQHLTGQRTVRTLGMGERGNVQNFLLCFSFLHVTPQTKTTLGTCTNEFFFVATEGAECLMVSNFWHTTEHTMIHCMLP